MKRLQLVSVLVLVTSYFAVAAAFARQSEPIVGPPAPQLVLSKTVWNFGTVKYGDTLKETFELRNTGGADLRITNLTGTCACTVAEMSRALIPPGESAQVTVRFDTTLRQGKIVASIKIQSNDPTRSLAIFSVIGVVKPLIVIEPESLTLSSPDRSAALHGSVMIHFNTPEPLTPKLAAGGSKLLAAKLEEVSAGRVYKLDIKLRTAPPIGLTRDAVVIETGYADQPTIRIPVYVNIQPRVQVTPAVIYIPRQVATKSYRQIRVQYFGQRRDFRVTAVQSSHEAVTVELRTAAARRILRRRRLASAPKYEQVVAVRLAPGGELPRQLEIKIMTNDRDFSVLSVPVTNDGERYRILVERLRARDGREAASSQPSQPDEPVPPIEVMPPETPERPTSS